MKSTFSSIRAVPFASTLVSNFRPVSSLPCMCMSCVIECISPSKLVVFDRVLFPGASTPTNLDNDSADQSLCAAEMKYKNDE